MNMNMNMNKNINLDMIQTHMCIPIQTYIQTRGITLSKYKKKG